MDATLQNQDAALVLRIAETQSKLQQFLSSQERALLAIRLRELQEDLAALRAIRRKQPCPYGLVEFEENDKGSLKLPESATPADFVHAFAHTLVRNLPSGTVTSCKRHLKTTGSDTDLEELIVCAFERFYWDNDADDRNSNRETLRKALRKVYPVARGTRIDVDVTPGLRELFRCWSRENSPSLSASETRLPSSTQQAWGYPMREPILSERELEQRNGMIARHAPVVNIPWQLLSACTLAVAVGLFQLPYGYYVILRGTICIAAAYGFSLALQHRSPRWGWIYGVVAILYNPVLPVRLGNKDLWIVLNVLTIALFWAAFVRSRFRSLATKSGSPLNPG